MATKQPIVITDEMRILVLNAIKEKESGTAICRMLGLSTYRGNKVIRLISSAARRKESDELAARRAEVLRNLDGLSDRAITVLLVRGLTTKLLVKNAMNAGELSAVFSDGRAEISAWLRKPPNAELSRAASRQEQNNGEP